MIVKLSDDEARVDGRAAVDDMLELFDLANLTLEDDDEYDTVGGLVYEAFGRVPRAGEAVTVGAYKLVVERVRRRRIERVYFERLQIWLQRRKQPAVLEHAGEPRRA